MLAAENVGSNEVSGSPGPAGRLDQIVYLTETYAEGELLPLPAAEAIVRQLRRDPGQAGVGSTFVAVPRPLKLTVGPTEVVVLTSTGTPESG